MAEISHELVSAGSVGIDAASHITVNIVVSAGSYYTGGADFREDGTQAVKKIPRDRSRSIIPPILRASCAYQIGSCAGAIAQLADEHRCIERKIRGHAVHNGSMPDAISGIGELAGRPVVDALGHPILGIPGVGSSSAGQGIAVDIICIGVAGTTEEHIRIVVGVVLCSVDSSSCIGLTQSISHRIEGVGLRLAIAIVHGDKPIHVVVAILLRARAAVTDGNPVSQPLARIIIGVGIAAQIAARRAVVPRPVCCAPGLLERVNCPVSLAIIETVIAVGIHALDRARLLPALAKGLVRHRFMQVAGDIEMVFSSSALIICYIDKALGYRIRIVFRLHIGNVAVWRGVTVGSGAAAGQIHARACSAKAIRVRRRSG